MINISTDLMSFFDLFTLLVGFLLLVIGFVLLSKLSSPKKYNIYFIIIVFLAGIQRALYGLYSLGFLSKVYLPLSQKLFYSVFLPPIFYLFFLNSLDRKTPNRTDINHFIIVVLLLVLIEIFDVDELYLKIIFFFYSTTYLWLLLLLLRNKVVKPKTVYEKQLIESKKYWLMLMTFLFTIIYFIANISALYSLPQINNVLMIFYNYSSIFWLFVSMYLLINPVIMYGNEYFILNSHKVESSNINVWNKKINTYKSSDNRGELTSIKINPREYIGRIMKFESEYINNYLPTPTLKNLSIYTKIPQSHLNYLFKHNCNYTFSEYLNVLKIQKSLKLLNEGYLTDKTIESLALTCHFNSRITFYNNFKKHIGISVSEYVNKPTI